MNGSRIAAVGHYQPAKVLTNEDLASLVDTSDEWIRSRVGIRTRHFAGPDEPVDELAGHAAAKALASAGLAPADIDLVLVATSTAEDRSPNMAARVAARLGIPSPAAMDINVVCAGFTHALATADHAVRAGAATRALVIGADKMSAVTDWSDRTTCVLVGDGAGAAVVDACPEGAEPGIGPVLWGSVPEMGHAVRIEGTPPRFAQEGQSVYRWATTQLPAIARRACERAGLTPADLAGVVLHQANLRIIEPLAAKIGAVNAVVARDVVESGNTSAASIPLAFSKLVERGEISTGDPVLLFGFGGNLSYAGQVIRCP
ncbi:3-oxoacyl-ACP synthase [Streptomyces avermitilis]|uniref:Beta-ketoacyl-[acyl-carrier-protein] synthase III 2 n=3 Tax=Streptomyces avermitilis TaxID=33903 RepID=FABH2_STRAW|nr:MULTISPECIES: beta-ketoacyl-ACP synthase III [Streptomyces]Q82M29.1 RecName: Full=Beta-ketoacyl-[acyl-carrier-protein] synthase III 2; Short=Beta-ketoacyl-ACP synthase III 2; Short=KAS III 2; AltName: Full=3-oxoacyl-[acyl-carrier-protein] synthase 3 2; AltName: Full=3-oxoacyl-[acyl-carrier-protein] synthase III 2 [Streptomyces avermitilis MA-4680 = NBRC 14893]KUN55888.1 3-oxoacyl-ACP synthase [Streptomyces avermitilis]MYS97456.1 beta-ketoacyl-ACP synthase III [Streptomyces sp. SID5469]OOV253